MFRSFEAPRSSKSQSFGKHRNFFFLFSLGTAKCWYSFFDFVDNNSTACISRLNIQTKTCSYTATFEDVQYGVYFYFIFYINIIKFSD